MSADSRPSGIEVTELQGGGEQPEHRDPAHHPSEVSTPKPRQSGQRSRYLSAPPSLPGIKPSSTGSLSDSRARSPPVRLSSSSSGYGSFELDSAPSSPFLQSRTPDAASCCSPPMTHGPQYPPEPLGAASRRDGNYGQASSSDQTFPEPVALAPDMQVEIRIGEELRTIGDQFDTVLMARTRLQERLSMMPFIALLLLVIGHLLYMRGTTDVLRDQSEL